MNSLVGDTKYETEPFKESDRTDARIEVNAGEANGDEAGPDVFRYEDYRRFLMDRFAELQSVDRAFSQRMLARKAGIANPGFFNEVIKGRRRLSPAAAAKMAYGLSLEADETEYFAALVEYIESRDNNARRAACQRMIALRNRKHRQPPERDHAGYYQNPAYPLVRAAIAVCDFRGDYALLSRSLAPALPEDAVRRCVEDLLHWGLVEKDGDGRYRAVHADPDLPSDAPSIVRNLNREWIGQGSSGDEARDAGFVSTLLPVSEKTFRRIQERIAEVRDQIAEMAGRDAEPARYVLQINVRKAQ